MTAVSDIQGLEPALRRIGGKSWVNFAFRWSDS